MTTTAVRSLKMLFYNAYVSMCTLCWGQAHPMMSSACQHGGSFSMAFS